MDCGADSSAVRAPHLCGRGGRFDPHPRPNAVCSINGHSEGRRLEYLMSMRIIVEGSCRRETRGSANHRQENLCDCPPSGVFHSFIELLTAHIIHLTSIQHHYPCGLLAFIFEISDTVRSSRATESIATCRLSSTSLQATSILTRSLSMFQLML